MCARARKWVNVGSEQALGRFLSIGHSICVLIRQQYGAVTMATVILSHAASRLPCLASTSWKIVRTPYTFQFHSYDLFVIIQNVALFSIATTISNDLHFSNARRRSQSTLWKCHNLWSTRFQQTSTHKCAHCWCSRLINGDDCASITRSCVFNFLSLSLLAQIKSYGFHFMKFSRANETINIFRYIIKNWIGPRVDFGGVCEQAPTTVE